jgi:hypothetical protein
MILRFSKLGNNVEVSMLSNCEIITKVFEMGNHPKGFQVFDSKGLHICGIQCQAQLQGFCFLGWLNFIG